MVGFPLFMSNKYYDIQDDKMYFMMYATAACAAVLCIIGIGMLAKKNTKEGTVKALLYRIKEYTGIPDRFALCFFAVLVISTVCSKWVYEAFWGNMGRYQGLYMWIFYIAGFLIISLLYVPKRFHADLFMLAGIIVAGWGVLDFFYMSPFGWQESAKDYMAFDFSSTIGNVNLLTGFDGMILTIASVLFMGSGEELPLSGNDGDGTESSIRKTQEKKSKAAAKARAESLLYFTAAFIAFMGLICGFSDNACISVGIALCFLPFFAFGNAKRLIRYLCLAAGCAGAMVLTGILISGGARTVSEEHWGILLEVCTKHKTLLLGLFILLAAAAVFAKRGYIAYRRKINTTNGEAAGAWRIGRSLRMIWAGLGIAAFILIIAVLYDANTGGHKELYAPFSNMLIFNEDWGTRRGFNWSLAMGYIKDFPIFNKLFGSGPETYPIYTYSYDYYKMVNAFNEVYDSPHNEWLQYLFTTGILGFVCYYGLVISSAVSGFGASGRKIGYKTEIAADGQAGSHINDIILQGLLGSAFAYGVITYTLVSFVNISAPCLTPMVILCMAAASAAGRSKKKST